MMRVIFYSMQAAVMENEATPSEQSDWRIQQHCGIRFLTDT